MNEAIEAEVRDVTVTNAPPPALFGTTDPVEIVAKARDVANALKDVIKQQGLVSTIQGREYVRCEGWTLLGTMLGVFPVNVWTREVEGGWEARVEARTRDGAVVGAAEAQCTRSESTWAKRDAYALRSMAQTRATSKALRMPLGFVVTLAGFSATPAEEMTFADKPFAETAPHVPPPSCPDHGLCRYVAGGVRKDGRPFNAFYTCENRGCKRGSQGRGFYADAETWQQNQKNLNQPPSTEVVDLDALPSE